MHKPGKNQPVERDAYKKEKESKNFIVSKVEGVVLLIYVVRRFLRDSELKCEEKCTLHWN